MRTFVITAVLILTAFIPAFAQRETGSIVGKITDSEGQALPGVTVTASSPSLIGGSSVSQSDSDGNYRFPVLPPGIYEIKAELQGFQTVIRKEIRLYVGNTFTVDLTSAPETVAEVIEVTGETPFVDTSSAQSSHTVPVEVVENLPKIGFALDLFTLAPGVGGDNVAFGAGGSSANAYWLDGVDLSDPSISTTWVFPNYNWIQEVNVVGVGAPAEYGGFTGVVANTVTKSGSNNFHGLFETFYQNDSLTSTNTGDLTAEQQDVLNPPTVEQFTDTTAQIGGPLKKDKFWFFTSFQYFYREDLVLGADRPVTDEEPRIFGKLTYKIDKNNNLQGFFEWDRFDIEGRGISATVPFEATTNEEAPNYAWNASWTSLINAETVLDARYAGFTGYFDLTPQNGQIPGHFSFNTGLSSVNAAFTNLNDRRRHQVNASLSHYANDFIKGDHDFKFGIEFERSKVQIHYYLNGGYYYLDYVGPGYYGYYTGPYIRYSGYSGDIDARINRVSAFAQDSWSITDKVRLDVGVRWDRNRGELTRQGTLFATDPVAPRLGLVVDVRGDHKTIVKAHYGHYYEATLASFFDTLDEFSDKVLEFFFIPTGEWIEFSRTPTIYTIDPDIKQPYIQQFTVGLDQELPAGIAFGAHYIYRKWKDIIEDVNISGVFEPITVTNPVTGEPITVFNQLNVGDNQFLMTNPVSGTCALCFEPEKDYHGFEVYANKRISNKFYINGSFVYSKARGTYDNRNNVGSTGGNNVGLSNLFDDPNFGINTDGRLTNDPEVEVKFQGIYHWPHGINTGFALRHNSGDNFTQRFQVGRSAGLSQGTTAIFALPRGSDRLDSITTFDLRLEKEFEIYAGRLRFTADFFNLFNQGVATSVGTIFGRDDFLEPITFTFPRQVRLGVRYTF